MYDTSLGSGAGSGRRRAVRSLCMAIVLAGILEGCAEKNAVVTPTPPLAPPMPRPVRREPPSPPPVVEPQVGLGDEDQLKQEVRGKIETAERVVKQIEQKKLPEGQRDTFLTIQSFLSKARDALSIKDFLRAFNLADKAQILAEELLSTLR